MGILSVTCYLAGGCIDCRKGFISFGTLQGWVEANEGSTLLDTLHKALDEVVKLAECEIYSYCPDSDADPFRERGAINLVAEGFLTDGIGYEEDGEIFDDMDM
ncbi:transcription regulator [Actinidia rufa]|uniref:Transcription regulator n=1 Tax=Actinidia rufa TaxID=165716 RepID=A0A7J0GZI1_9ERIC|nr:transcription regulator [Actinidia rufa]